MSNHDRQRGREQFAKYSILLDMLKKFIGLFPKKIRLKLLLHWRSLKGIKGMALRYAVLKTLANHVGENVSIHPDVYIFNPEALSIGNNVSIHPMCYIEAKGGITIGSDVSIAHAVTCLSVHHINSDIFTPIKEQGIENRPLTIGSNIWIGAKAILLGGVSVANGAIIGAGSVVTKSVCQNTIVAGNPARVIRERT